MAVVFLVGFTLWALVYVTLHQDAQKRLSEADRDRWKAFYAVRDGLYLATPYADRFFPYPRESALLVVSGERIEMFIAKNSSSSERLEWALFDEGRIRYGEVLGRNRYMFAIDDGHAYMNDATFDKIPSRPVFGGDLLTMQRIDDDIKSGVKPAWPAP